MRKMRITAVWWCLCIVSANGAWAWTRAGHMATGALAYAHLAETHPEAIDRAVTLLRAHPRWADWQAACDAAGYVSPADRARFVFMAAAKWADETRHTPYYHPTWHYVNPPLSATEQTPLPAATVPPPENILYAYQLNLDLVRADTTAAVRAVALSWLFHLVGDLHQPLHTVAFFSDRFPEGDRGGNLFFVRPTAADTTVTFHYFWDGLGTTSERKRDLRRTVRQLRRRPAPPTSVVPDALAALVYAESYALARWAYREGTLAAGVDRAHGAVLPKGYPEEAEKRAETRLALAGRRLADLLRQLPL